MGGAACKTLKSPKNRQKTAVIYGTLVLRLVYAIGVLKKGYSKRIDQVSQ